MLKVAVRRVVQLVPVLFGLSIVVFAWVRALPGDPSAALLASGNGTADPAVTREAAAEVRRLNGLDRPLYKQYVSWLGRTVRLDFGQSITTRQDVSSELRRRFPATVELTLAALVLTVGLGIPSASRLPVGPTAGSITSPSARAWSVSRSRSSSLPSS